MVRADAIPREEGRHAFGDDPAGYERGRLAYPAAVFDRLEARFGALAGHHVFEIGPGTGQATRPLLARGVAALHAIEPDARLAAWLRAHVADPRLTVIAEPFEQAELTPGVHDLGVSATAFHWLDPAPALARVRRALRPGGGWAMWWNAYADPDIADPFRDATKPLFDALGTPHGRGIAADRPYGLDRDARLADLREAGFAAIEIEMLTREAELDTGALVALYATFSQVRRLPDDRRTRFLADLAEVADRDFGGRVIRPVRTPLYTAISG